MTDVLSSNQYNDPNREATPTGGHRLSDAAYRLRVLERIRTRIRIDQNGCWLWQGQLGTTGYAQIQFRGRPANAHRVSYKLHYEVELKTEEYVLHRCDVRNCVNPEHLWIGTAKDNNADCAKKGRHHRGTRTQCPKGHPYDEQNTTWKPSKSGGMARGCRACINLGHRTESYLAWRKEYQRRRRAEKKAAKRAQVSI